MTVQTPLKRSSSPTVLLLNTSPCVLQRLCDLQPWCHDTSMGQRGLWPCQALALAGSPPLGLVLGEVQARQCSSLHPRDDSEHSVQIDVADEAIRSDTFWAYLFMLSLVGEFLSRVASWAESCPCHDAEPGLRGATYHERCKAKLKALGARICPMSGRRAPECAAGALYDLLIGLFEIGHATLLMADPVRR